MAKKHDKVRPLLIYPPITTYGSDSPGAAALPLGLAYIAAVLEQEGYEVKILDAAALGGVKQGNNYVHTGLDRDAVREYIRDFAPSIVGISSMFTAYARNAHEVARIVKKIDPNTPVVFGGAHVSANHNLVLRDENVDMVVNGEGEITFLEIVQALERGADLKHIAGTVTRIDGKVHVNPERPFIKDLDALPLPARHLLPMDRYLEQWTPFHMRKPVAVMITSRGCPKRCIFCSIHAVWGYTWRARSAKSVADEIELLVSQYGVREIAFQDDNISLNKRRMGEICDEMMARQFDIKWTTPNGIAEWTLDEPLLRKMKKSGCYRLTFGIESGNPETQKFIQKKLNLEHARSIINSANKIGLWTACTNIIGFPQETREAIEDTIDFAITSGTDFALFYPLTAFIGSPVYEMLNREGLIPLSVDENPGFFVTESTKDTTHFTRKEVEDIQSYAYSKFMSHRLRSYLKNPLRMLRKIRSIEDLRYTVRVAWASLAVRSRISRNVRAGAKAFYGKEPLKEG